jgi:hypothetical protein
MRFCVTPMDHSTVARYSKKKLFPSYEIWLQKILMDCRKYVQVRYMTNYSGGLWISVIKITQKQDIIYICKHPKSKKLEGNGKSGYLL